MSAISAPWNPPGGTGLDGAPAFRFARRRDVSIARFQVNQLLLCRSYGTIRGCQRADPVRTDNALGVPRLRQSQLSQEQWARLLHDLGNFS
ncbi:hypothetical protein OPV22_034764 [Ensete ventricosum]|uniref:Uncharacterized protein n=1 Tax=Ensete ventricosum TaxID=4639 RepID=A0AAV8PMG0_ENSVE|nr:hypothetical protein OPV22_034764 [Ensete ventricosum]